MFSELVELIALPDRLNPLGEYTLACLGAPTEFPEKFLKKLATARGDAHLLLRVERVDKPESLHHPN